MAKKPRSTAARKKGPPGRKPARKSSARFLPLWLDYLRSECQLSDNTLTSYQRDMRRFFQWLGNGSLKKLTIKELSQYVKCCHN